MLRDALCEAGAAAAAAAATLAAATGDEAEAGLADFARKYAFDSIFQDLQYLHTFALLQSQNFSKKYV